LSLLGYGISKPIRRVRSDCCALAVNGNAAAPPIRPITPPHVRPAKFCMFDAHFSKLRRRA
jgi:hypothetical protein